jgi:hypothetical protein
MKLAKRVITTLISVANPAIVNCNAGAVKNDNAKSSLVRLEKKTIFSSLLQRWLQGLEEPSATGKYIMQNKKHNSFFSFSLPCRQI